MLVAQGVPALHNCGMVQTHEAARRGFKVQITGSGHGTAFLAVRQALRKLKRTGQSPSLSQHADDFAGMTDLHSLPAIYDMETRYQVRPQAV